MFNLSPGWYRVLSPALDQFTGVDTVPHAQGAGGRLPVITGNTDDHSHTWPVICRLQLHCNTVTT